MKTTSILVGILLLIGLPASGRSQEPVATSSDSNLKVILLATAAGPTLSAQRLGISTLVLAGREKLLFDCGRSMTTSMARLAIDPADVTKVFLTHLHSDHIVSLPELYLFPWAQGRTVPLQVWGPDGTRSMVKHLQQAFSFDIHVRRDVDERLSVEGIKIIATDIREGVVYEANGVKVTAFLVDHGPVKPAFGYRVDYRGHSVVMSGDTKPSDNLVKFSQGVDVLIHELGRSKQDPALVGPPDEFLPISRQTRAQVTRIADHHTDGKEAGRIFEQVKPKLAVFSHFNNAPAETLPLVRESYAGSVEFGEDLMTIDIGDTVSVRRFAEANR
jgi:ribonuclease Z